MLSSGFSVGKTTWEQMQRAAQESGQDLKCPITRSAIEAAGLPNYDLRTSNEKIWARIELLYQDMLTPSAVSVSVFQRPLLAP